MRKFVAQYSSGLRVRLNPSLQSEQVGIIKPNGIISFIDEVKICIFIIIPTIFFSRTSRIIKHMEGLRAEC